MFTNTMLRKAASLALAATAGFGTIAAGGTDDSAFPQVAATTTAQAPADQAYYTSDVLAAAPLTTGVAAVGPLAADQAFRSEMRAYLNTLPGGGSTGLEWGNPQGHLGGVYIPGGSTIILNAARLEGNAAKTKDVMRHEIAHIHQNRVIANNGLSVANYQARLNEVFGSNGIERSADAVAYLLGAGSYNYQSSFNGAQLAAARAILADQLG